MTKVFCRTMGVKLLVLALLVISANVRGQDLGESVTEKTEELPLDQQTEAFPEIPKPEDNVPVPAEPEKTATEENTPEESVIELLPDSQPDLEVRNGKYQVLSNDALVGEEPVELEAVDVEPNADTEQSERQLLFPPTTTTTNEYCKYIKEVVYDS